MARTRAFDTVTRCVGHDAVGAQRWCRQESVGLKIGGVGTQDNAMLHEDDRRMIVMFKQTLPCNPDKIILKHLNLWKMLDQTLGFSSHLSPSLDIKLVPQDHFIIRSIDTTKTST